MTRENPQSTPSPAIPLSLHRVLRRGLELEKYAETLQDLAAPRHGAPEGLGPPIGMCTARGSASVKIHDAWTTAKSASSRCSRSTTCPSSASSRRRARIRVFAPKCSACCRSARNVVSVRAMHEVLDEGAELPPRGLPELRRRHDERDPRSASDGVRRGATRMSLALEAETRTERRCPVPAARRRRGRRDAHLPFADAALLVPIQIAHRLVGISSTFGAGRRDDAFFGTLVSSVTGTVGAQLSRGRAYRRRILQAHPRPRERRSVAPYSGATAATLTTTLGHSYVAVLGKLLEGSSRRSLRPAKRSRRHSSKRSEKSARTDATLSCQHETHDLRHRFPHEQFSSLPRARACIFEPIPLDPHDDESDGVSAPFSTTSEDSTWSFGAEALRNYVAYGMRGRLMRSIKRFLPVRTFWRMATARYAQSENRGARRRVPWRDAHPREPSLRRGRAARAPRAPGEVLRERRRRSPSRETRLAAAARFAGFEEIRFCPEPEATAYDFRSDMPGACTVLVADLGGGTSDYTVVRWPESGASSVLSTFGVPIAGDALDGSLMRHKVAKHFGAGVTYKVPFGANTLTMPKPLSWSGSACPRRFVSWVGETSSNLLKDIRSWSSEKTTRSRWISSCVSSTTPSAFKSSKRSKRRSARSPRSLKQISASTTQASISPSACFVRSSSRGRSRRPTGF